MPETARYLGVSPRTIFAWRKAGTLRPVVLPGVRRLLFDRLVLDRFIRACSAARPPDRPPVDPREIPDA